MAERVRLPPSHARARQGGKGAQAAKAKRKNMVGKPLPALPPPPSLSASLPLPAQPYCLQGDGGSFWLCRPSSSSPVQGRFGQVCVQDPAGRRSIYALALSLPLVVVSVEFESRILILPTPTPTPVRSFLN